MAQQPLRTLDAGRSEFDFARTICACPVCVQYCQFIPGYLVPADLQRILDHLAPGEDLFAWCRRHLLASPGAKVMRGGRVFRIPTLVPARRADGSCRFLTADDRCAIHTVAPFGCVFFDAHQSAAEADRRSKRGLRAVLEAWQSGDVYARVWAVLAEAGLVAPPPETCRLQLRRAEEQSSTPKGQPS